MSDGLPGRAPPAPLFSVSGLRVRFEGRTVLSVDALSIEEGRITVLVGDNGSGKTTLLRILNGLISPDEGRVEFRGRPVPGEGLEEARGSSVLVHERPLLFRGSVGFNVEYGLRRRGLSREEARIRGAEALAHVGLPGFESRRAAGLSGGERQRVALARALVLAPRVLLLDEPTANVDAASKREIEAIIRRARDEGASVIMSTHDRDLAYRLCDRLVRLEAGTPGEVEENILKGRIEKTDEEFAYFHAGNALLRCPSRQGEFVVAVLPFDELILSRQPLASSARNQLHGTVTSVQQGQTLLRVVVDCGVPLTALVTREAAREVGVEPGAPCVVTFKASAVRLH
jgi:tungstate transport system ATP-binding protein